MILKQNHLQKPIFKITASLLNSWNYIFECDEDNSDSALDSFIDTLKRVKKPPNIYMQRGIDFEKDCYAGRVPFISDIIAGGEFQYYGELDLEVDDLDIRILGYLDVLKAGTIYDIKRVTKYELQKYFNSYQHHIYFALVPEAFNFEYLVASGYNDNYIDIFTEEYKREDAKDVKDIIHTFFEWLKENELFETYKNNWEIPREKKEILL